jgi:glycerol kinase
MVLAIDQGTTATTVIIFDENGAAVGTGQAELAQQYPQAGWVEHDPNEIWNTTVTAIRAALAHGEVDPSNLKAIGIANQRETTIVWDRRTGEPIHSAICWQCRRTTPICQGLFAKGLSEEIREKTGLIVDPYFSATKIRWILDSVDGAQKLAEQGHLAFGTVDSWLIWKLTGGSTHSTDYTNASRTLLLNINTKKWDRDLLGYLNIPMAMMPKVCFSSVMYGKTACPDIFPKPVTISGVAGDQQASLYGQLACESGQAKATYGTGCFLLQYTGAKVTTSSNGMLSTMAIDQHGGPAYAIEGAVFNAGSAVQWLRDGLGVIADVSETETYANQVPDTLGVYVVPAFTGMGAPYWNMNMRGGMFGITRGTARHHIIRATLESIAYQTADVLDAIVSDSGMAIPELYADGGASENGFLMQFQADILGAPVVCRRFTQITAAGAALLAGVGAGVWNNPTQVSSLADRDRVYDPVMGEDQRLQLRDGWKRAVEAAAAF